MEEESMVENTLYLGPEAEKDAPKCKSPDAQSRAIDILVAKEATQPPFRVDSSSHYIHTPWELKDDVEKEIVGKDDAETQLPLDRIYYENNWPFARNYLVRRFVKGIFENSQAVKTNVQEDPNLAKFQGFLQSAERREELDFSYFGLGSTLDVKLIAGPDRLLFYFGFDWMAIDRSGQSDTAFKTLRIHTKRSQGEPSIVRRRTCIACIFKVQNDQKLWNSPIFPDSWAAKSHLNHRRTLILFNELHSPSDSLPFYDWLSPEKTKLWGVKDEANLTHDDEISAVTFMHNLTVCIWKQVVHEWQAVIDACSEHIRTYEEQAIDTRLSIADLELLAQHSWNDTLSWFTLQKLLLAHQKSLSTSLTHLNHLSSIISLTSTLTPQTTRLTSILEQLKQLEDLISTDFTRRESAISDLVYNIISVKSAQAAQDYAESMGRITWITFLFFPLITVAGLFGMNVDVLADDPSLKWYFVVAVPATVVVLGVAAVLQNVADVKVKMRERFLGRGLRKSKRKEGEREKHKDA